jgi:hypothetical protein
MITGGPPLTGEASLSNAVVRLEEVPVAASARAAGRT